MPLIFLSACVSNTPDPIETTEHFTSRVGDSGQVQFAFGLLWQNSQVDPSFNKHETPERRRQGNDNTPEQTKRRNARFGQQPDNETKLDLEELAAVSLAKRLKNEALCANGYAVEEVIWENQRIRLMGVCL